MQVELFNDHVVDPQRQETKNRGKITQPKVKEDSHHEEVHPIAFDKASSVFAHEQKGQSNSGKRDDVYILKFFRAW